MSEVRRTRYRSPLTAVIVPGAVLLPLGFLADSFFYSGVGLLLGSILTGWQVRLELTETHAVVRNLRTVRIPWSSVSEVRAGPRWRGGLVLKTASYEEIWAGAPASWWGGAPDPAQVAEVERWWIDHRGPSWALAAPFVHRPPPPRPRYRTSALAAALAAAGLVVAAANAAALSWPVGTFSALGVEVVEPELDGLGWMVVAAVVAGLVIGVALAVCARKALSRDVPPAAVDAPHGRTARFVMIYAGIGLANAGFQWLGVVPAIGSLIQIAFGLTLAVGGSWLAGNVRRFEQRTGRAVLSTYPFSKGLGLETGWPAGP